MLGICNGFQVLCEAGLLPGALLPNAGLRFVCRQVDLEVVDADTPFTRACARGRAAVDPGQAHHRPLPRRRDASSSADASSCATRPATTPTAPSSDIAGVRNEAGNVFGLMPHPEHAVDALTGSTDGLQLFESMAARRRRLTRARRRRAGIASSGSPTPSTS